MTVKPKNLRKRSDRDYARWMRNHQWMFVEKIAEFGVVWFCPWDKYRKHEHPAENEEVDGPIGYGILDWMCSHREWFEQGRWSEKRCARPIRLTEAGLTALANWHLYDMEPVFGGLVEPGWRCVPSALLKKKSEDCSPGG